MNTQTQQKLENAIAELKAKAELEDAATTLFPGKKITTFFSLGKKYISIKDGSQADFKECLQKLPPTENETIIKSATKTLAAYNSPFRINIENPPTYSPYSHFAVEIEYTSGEYRVNMIFPIELFNDFVHTAKRNLSESEYHYFTGTSYKSLREMKVICYEFNADQIGWYGGNKTLKDEKEISNIIDSLQNK